MRRFATMAFEAAKEKYLKMPLAQKREKYYNEKYVTLDKIPSFEKISDAIKTKYPSTYNRIYLWRGDITTLEVDAIVNAANENLFPGGGVCGSIHRAAGDKLAAECKSLDGCPTGSAVLTGGYKLPAKYVIQAVGPMGEYPEELESTYKSILKLCAENKLSSVAIPCISTGIFGYPPENAARVALKTVLENLPDEVEKCILCTFLKEDTDIYTDLLNGDEDIEESEEEEN